ncbi:MAG TPA: long-chain fatty acid--CoA ligase [Nitrospiria bacterium]|nr:long-chain fatty acid--CoA ligase [Nitrospiria bacterium]
MMSTRDDILAGVLREIFRDPADRSDDAFNDVALSLLVYQYEHSVPYRRLCQEAGKDPSRILHWREIPPVPVTAFKWLDLACRPLGEALRVFRSSGTTEGSARRSSHYLFDLELAESAILPSFQRHLLPEGKKRPMFILTPSPEESPDSSLAFMMGSVSRKFGEGSSRFYIRDGRLQAEALFADLQKVDGPILLLGTSISFISLLDFLISRNLSLRLPAGSRLMDTGGFKGTSREISRQELYALYEARFGIPESSCVNEYGMAEMSSQFYDRIAGRNGSRLYVPPPQVRTEVFDPHSLSPLPAGEVGLLCHFDLANLDSVFPLLTQDLGRKVDVGFQLIGRTADAESKGCSLWIDRLLQGAS